MNYQTEKRLSNLEQTVGSGAKGFPVYDLSALEDTELAVLEAHRLFIAGRENQERPIIYTPYNVIEYFDSKFPDDGYVKVHWLDEVFKATMIKLKPQNLEGWDGLNMVYLGFPECEL